MKSLVRYIAFSLFGIFLLIACQNKTKSIKLSFEPDLILLKQGNIEIDIEYPQIKCENGAEENIQILCKKINEDISLNIALMTPADEENQDIKKDVTDKKMLQSKIIDWAQNFTKEEEKEDFPSPYQLYGKWDAFYNPEYASIYLGMYSFTGGAHGNFEARYLNYNLESGRAVDLFSLIKNEKTLLNLAREEFCKERNLSMDSPTEESHLFGPISEIPMPQTLGLCDTGLIFYYQPYEIAPWSTGAIKIIIPYNLLTETIITL